MTDAGYKRDEETHAKIQYQHLKISIKSKKNKTKTFLLVSSEYKVHLLVSIMSLSGHAENVSLREHVRKESRVNVKIPFFPNALSVALSVRKERKKKKHNCVCIVQYLPPITTFTLSYYRYKKCICTIVPYQSQKQSGGMICSGLATESCK